MKKHLFILLLLCLVFSNSNAGESKKLAICVNPLNAILGSAMGMIWVDSSAELALTDKITFQTDFTYMNSNGNFLNVEQGEGVKLKMICITSKLRIYLGDSMSGLYGAAGGFFMNVDSLSQSDTTELSIIGTSYGPTVEIGLKLLLGILFVEPNTSFSLPLTKFTGSGNDNQGNQYTTTIYAPIDIRGINFGCRIGFVF